MTMKERYGAFVAFVKEIHDLNRAEELLSWDQQTIMPPKGAGARASQLSTLAGIRHEMVAGDRLAEILAGLDESEGGGLDEDGRVNVREVRRVHDRGRKVPTKLVKELTRLQSLSQQAWVEAREESDYGKFAPWLEKILGVKFEIADAIGYAVSRYDAFLDEFEPGASSAEIAAVFDSLKKDLVPFVRRVLEAERSRDLPPLDLRVPVPRQEAYALELVKAIGFDMEAGRLDLSAHPFTSGNLHDVRLTNRYNEDDPRTAIFGALHEAGHGMYEQGVDPAHEGLPRAASVSLGIHESQSRMWENMVGRSLPFWEFALPLWKKTSPEAELPGLERWHREVNRVEASLIRVEADEVTYNLHILIRFEIEKEIAEKRIAVADLPGLWNEKVEEYLGITPPDDAKGVLQDIHWSFGLFGYFPTYALGNLYAAQFYRKAKEALPGLEEDFSRGEFAPLLDRLRREIHGRGQTYPAGDLVKVVTGEPLDARYLMEYLEEKYSAIYGL